MKITLTQQEIEQAVREFVSKGMTFNGNTEMVVDFTAGRGDNGLTATIDVPYLGLSSLPNAAASAAPAQTIKAVITETAPAAVEDKPAAVEETPVEVRTGGSIFGSPTN